MYYSSTSLRRHKFFLLALCTLAFSQFSFADPILEMDDTVFEAKLRGLAANRIEMESFLGRLVKLKGQLRPETYTVVSRIGFGEHEEHIITAYPDLAEHFIANSSNTEERVSRKVLSTFRDNFLFK